MARDKFELPLNSMPAKPSPSSFNIINLIPAFFKSLIRSKGNDRMATITQSSKHVIVDVHKKERHRISAVFVITLIVVSIFITTMVLLLSMPTLSGGSDQVSNKLDSNPKSSTHQKEKDRNHDHNRNELDVLESDPPKVVTKLGSVVGEAIQVGDTMINRYRGIPYAEAPIEDLRFARPLPAEPWSGDLIAASWPEPCVQFIPQGTITPWISNRSNGSEDCLYLNIWTPAKQKGDLESSLKTVMVWFHGGAFFSGSSDVDIYSGEYLSAIGDVVVVSLNYRLGALGFLNANLDQFSGNMGMYDQVMALNWIKDNIEYFGGDPSSLVLFGQSAGATSAGLHLFSPLSRNLTNRVILESGSPLFPKNYFDNSFEKSQEYTHLVGCSDSKSDLSSNPDKVLDCLRNLPIDELMKGHEPMFQKYKIPFFPRHGDDFLPDLPHEAIADFFEFDKNKPEVLIGTTEDEGSFFLHLFFPDFFTNTAVNGTLDIEKAKSYISKAYSFIPERQAKMMSEFFLSGLSKDATKETILKVTYDVIGNSGFTCPAVQMSETMSEQNMSVYHYMFTHRPSSTPWGEWLGSTHLDEVEFVFGMPLKEPAKYEAAEVQFSERLIRTWTQFAKNG